MNTTQQPNNTGPLPGILGTITFGKMLRPILVTLFGPDGVGKTTWAAGAPNPVFVGTEKGTYQLEVARLPQPVSLGNFLQQLDALIAGGHPFQSVVIDSLDWLEPFIHRQVCAEGKVRSIEKYEKGYGKGYVRALEIWRGITDKFAALNLRYHVILIAHSRIKKFDDPDLSAGYDRYQIAIHEYPAALIRQLSDAVLFANYKAGKPDERVFYTQCRPAFDAKNRFSLPFEMPLKWEPFGRAVKAFYNSSVAPAPVEPEPEPAPEAAPEPELEPEPEPVG